MKRTVGLSKLLLVLALVVPVVAWVPAGAEATISYSLDFIFSGEQPANTGPWGTISFTTTAAGTGTTVTMAALGGATGLGSTEFIGWWGFSSTALVATLTVPTSVTGAANGTITKCDACLGNKADGDGFYDIVVQFQTANNNGGAGRLIGGETVSF